MNDRDKYISPFSTRYASPEMQAVFSDNFKFRTWRRLWIALARAEKELGLPITDAQIAELEAHADDINYDVAEAREKADGLLKQAGDSIELERKKAAGEIKEEIVTVSTALAEKLLEREVRAEDHRELIAAFMKEIGENHDLDS